MKKELKLLLIISMIIIGIITISGCIGDDSTSSNTINHNIIESGQYTTKEDVASYISTYHKLPSNFITKKEARKLGWEGGSLEKYAPGKSIGGDKFTNREKSLPEGKTYTECDINTKGANSRGGERIVFSNDFKIYYTGDHYKTFSSLN